MSTRGKLIFGGVLTYSFAVFVGYQYNQGKKPNTDPHIDPRDITLNDAQRIASFNNHATSYDSGKNRCNISYQSLYASI
jgi:hypothetical protein